MLLRGSWFVYEYAGWNWLRFRCSRKNSQLCFLFFSNFWYNLVHCAMKPPPSSLFWIVEEKLHSLIILHCKLRKKYVHMVKCLVVAMGPIVGQCTALGFKHLEDIIANLVPSLKYNENHTLWSFIGDLICSMECLWKFRKKNMIFIV